MCKASALDQNEVAGKVVLCDNSTKIDVFDQMEEVERAGAYAGIFLVDISDLEPDDFIIPSLILDTASGTLVRKYVTEDSKAKVKVPFQFWFRTFKTGSDSSFEGLVPVRFRRFGFSSGPVFDGSISVPVPTVSSVRVPVPMVL
ncbi:hypothetical protein LWI28_013481 [Acer negundo]|uniref:Uncharacterized protein n=1 Tax=Acer negundo TaxID=4023 RepID=A0AAD5NJK6_ACENE|nr:hypothetical protein LWI28_013481 [Acer negundo]